METPKPRKMELDGMQNAGISAKERLAKIEDKLDMVLGKLDNKADKTDFISLERRVREIELHGTPQTQGIGEQIKLHREEFIKEIAEIVKGQSKIRANVAYMMGGAAALMIIIELIFRK